MVYNESEDRVAPIHENVLPGLAHNVIQDAKHHLAYFPSRSGSVPQHELLSAIWQPLPLRAYYRLGWTNNYKQIRAQTASNVNHPWTKIYLITAVFTALSAINLHLCNPGPKTPAPIFLTCRPKHSDKYHTQIAD